MNSNEKMLLEKFVCGQREAKIQHSLEFMEVIKTTYKNCVPNYIINKECLYPFFIVKSAIFGNRLISLPFLDVGGFLGEPQEKTIKEIINNSEKEKITKIEVRLNNSLENFKETQKILKNLGFEEEPEKQQFIICLSSEDKMWKNFHKHTRNDIRKAEKSGLELKEIENEYELKRFYKLYSKEMRDFGTPQHSFKFFKNVLKIMKNKYYSLNCYLNGKLIASIILFYEKKYGYIAFNVSDKRYREYRPNDLLYWNIIKTAIKKNVEYVDMGQVEKDAEKETRAHGLYNFKKKWLGTLYDRIYFTYSLKKIGKKGNKEKLKKFRKIWKKLPLFLTKIIGPKITSQMGL